jgi:hypothetical protein
MQRRTAVSVAAALLSLAAAAARGQSPIVITGFERGGDLTWSNSEPGIVSFRLEWAASLDGAWTSDWTSFRKIPNTKTNYAVALPRFYRVIGLPRPPGSGAPDASTTPDVVPAPERPPDGPPRGRGHGHAQGGGTRKRVERSR